MADLAHVLRQLPSGADPAVLLGTHFADDAAVYRLSDELALVQSVDFFTPIVDDPYTFGQIAAANSLSDVYAVGGKPITALNICAFPVGALSNDIYARILRGGADKAAEAGVPIVGGHTVNDPELKYGMAITGVVHPDRFISAHAALPGDALVLTKPLGTGSIATALKAEAVTQSHLAHAVRWMTHLNRDASLAMVSSGAHAATDVTGFGLLGHLLELCRASSVSAVVEWSSVPRLPGALEYIRRGHVPGGAVSNLQYVRPSVSMTSLREEEQLLLADPQTSGGLLVSLAPESVTEFVEALGPNGLGAVIGYLDEPGSAAISVR